MCGVAHPGSLQLAGCGLVYYHARGGETGDEAVIAMYTSSESLGSLLIMRLWERLVSWSIRNQDCVLAACCAVCGGEIVADKGGGCGKFFILGARDDGVSMRLACRLIEFT